MATRNRTDFNISYKSSTNSNGFNLRDDRACISQRAHTAPKSAFWCSKNSGFVVFTMSPGMHRCCHRRPRIIHRRGRNCTRTQEITTFAISHAPANHCGHHAARTELLLSPGNGRESDLGIISRVHGAKSTFNIKTRTELTILSADHVATMLRSIVVEHA